MVQVRRQHEAGDRPSTYLVDLNKLIKEGQTHLNLAIEGGDVIFVPEAGTVYVDGAVRKPGNYNITKEMTVLEAIVAAGGFSNIAEQEAIKLVRSEDGRQEVAELQKSDLKSQDIQIKDRDVIFVETDKMEAFMYGLRLNIGGGLMGVGYSPASR